MKKIVDKEEMFKKLAWEFGKFNSLIAVEYSHCDHEKARFLLESGIA